MPRATISPPAGGTCQDGVGLGIKGGDAAVFHGGVITQDTTLISSAAPYVISSDILVSGDITLTIQPSVTLHFEPDRVIRVEHGARLLAEGTSEQPIIFTVSQSGTYWGGILFYDTRADNRIQHSILEYIHEVIESPRSHGVSGYGADFTIADSVMRHFRRSNAVIANYDSTLYLLRNDIYDIGSDAVHPTGGYAYIQGNRIHDSFYDPGFNPAPPEGIELSSMDTPAVVLDNHIYNITDDCLDLNYSSALIARNIMHHCGDKGISVGHTSSTTLVNNLVYECWGNDADPDHTGFGIALKDGAVSRLVHNTLVRNRHGLGLYEMHPGQGGATVSVANTILWDNDANLEARDGSSLTVRYSNVGGYSSGDIWPGEGNLNVDPGFRDGREDFHLRDDSPLIDAGYDEGFAVDLDGLPRRVGNAPDIGAYEVQARLHLSGWPGDQTIYLAWQLFYAEPDLVSLAISYTVQPRGTMTIIPSPDSVLITGLPTETRAYTLTGLSNYYPHIVVVEARDAEQHVLLRSNPVSVTPSERRVYLPAVLKSYRSGQATIFLP